MEGSPCAYLFDNDGTGFHTDAKGSPEIWKYFPSHFITQLGGLHEFDVLNSNHFLTFTVL